VFELNLYIAHGVVSLKRLNFDFVKDFDEVIESDNVIDLSVLL
jgi:hypothetical protein